VTPTADLRSVACGLGPHLAVWSPAFD
jgi:hypothetical protein